MWGRDGVTEKPCSDELTDSVFSAEEFLESLQESVEQFNRGEVFPFEILLEELRDD